MKKVWTRFERWGRPRGGATPRVSVLGRAAPLLVAAPVLVAACERDAPPRREPPPIASQLAPGACAQAESAPRDPFARALLPLRSGTLCADPHGAEKAYGEDAEKPFDRACDELLDGECEIYRSLGALRTMEVRYIDDSGSSATATVLLTKFNTSEGAYAMFTLRVVGDGDPAAEATPKRIEAAFTAAAGANNAYVVRGPFLAEVVLTDEAAGSVAALRAAAERHVVPLAKAIGAKLTGDPSPPPAAGALPASARLPLGVRYHTRDMLGVAGAGPGAVGYYREGGRRYRVAAMLRPDGDQAKDLLATLAKEPGASREKAPYDGFVRLIVQPAGELPAEWVLGRARGVVLGVGDEVRVLRDTMTSEERSKLLLSTKEKMEKLTGMLEESQKR
jgi:hypothetical protein